MAAPTITLKPTGQKIPVVGFGCWKVPNDQTADVVYNAIKNGYRHFDEACDYGNEKEAGEGIRRAIADGLVKREDLFITTKLWATFHAPEHVAPAIKRQLSDFGLDYFDLYLMHFPLPLKYVDPAERYPPNWSSYPDKWETVVGTTPLIETWRAMEKLVDAGLTKNIGVCNFQGCPLLDIVRSARVKPAMLQIEHHPYLVQPQLLQLCKESDIAVTGYSSFGPQSYRDMQAQKALDTPLPNEHEAVVAAAKKHGKSPYQILLKWAVQRYSSAAMSLRLPIRRRG